MLFVIRNSGRFDFKVCDVIFIFEVVFEIFRFNF